MIVIDKRTGKRVRAIRVNTSVSDLTPLNNVFDFIDTDLAHTSDVFEHIDGVFHVVETTPVSHLLVYTWGAGGKYSTPMFKGDLLVEREVGLWIPVQGMLVTMDYHILECSETEYTVIDKGIRALVARNLSVGEMIALIERTYKNVNGFELVGAGRLDGKTTVTYKLFGYSITATEYHTRVKAADWFRSCGDEV